MSGTPPHKRSDKGGQGYRASERPKQLHETGIIDARLLDWSQQLRVFRNIGAHASDQSILREDAEDLRVFVYAIIEYIYDLAERYAEFQDRQKLRAKRKTPGL